MIYENVEEIVKEVSDVTVHSASCHQAARKSRATLRTVIPVNGSYVELVRDASTRYVLIGHSD